MTVPHIQHCHERFMALMMGSQSGQTASARLRAFSALKECDDVGTLAEVRQEIRTNVCVGADPKILRRIDNYEETARDELIAAQVMADTSYRQDRFLQLAHKNAATRLAAARGGCGGSGSGSGGSGGSAKTDHSKSEQMGKGGGLASAATSYAHIAGGNRFKAPKSRLEYVEN